MPRPARRSRRTRNEPPEIVPKSEDEADEEENDDGKLVEPKVEPESDTKVEIKSDAKVEIKSDAKVEIKSDAKAEIKSDTKAEIKSTRRSTRVRKPKTRSTGSNSAATRGQKKRQAAASSDDQKSKDDEEEKKSDSSDDETDKNSKGKKSAKEETMETPEGSRDGDMSNDESEDDGDRSATPSKTSRDTKGSQKADSQVRKSRRTPNKKSKETEIDLTKEESDQDEEEGDDGSGDDQPTSDSPVKQKAMPQSRQGADKDTKAKQEEAKQEEADNKKESENEKRSSHSEDGESSATQNKKSQSSTEGLQQATRPLRKSRRRANKSTTGDHLKVNTNKVDHQSSDQEIKDDERSGGDDEASVSEDGDESATPSKASRSNKATHIKAAVDAEDDGDDSSTPSKASRSTKRSEKPAGGSRKSRRRTGKKTEEEEDRQSGGKVGQNETKVDSDDDGEESASPSKASRGTKGSEQPTSTPRRSRRRVGKKKKEEDDGQSSGEDALNETNVDSDDGGESATPSKASRSTKGSEKLAGGNRKSRRRRGKMLEEIREEVDEDDEERQSGREDEQSKSNDSLDNTPAKKAATEGRRTRARKKDMREPTRKNRKRPRTESTPLPRADAIKTETLSDENLSSEGENESDGGSSASSVSSVTSKNKVDVNSHVSGGSRESKTKTKIIPDGPKDEIRNKNSGETDTSKANDNETDGANKPIQGSEGDGTEAESNPMVISEKPETGTKTGLQEGGSVQNRGQASTTPGDQNVGEANEKVDSDPGQGKDSAPAGDHEISLNNARTSVASPSEQIKNAPEEEGSSSSLTQKESCVTDDAPANKPVDPTRESSTSLPPTGTSTNQADAVDKTNDTMLDETNLPLDKKTTEPEPGISIRKRAMSDEKGTIPETNEKESQSIENDDGAEESRPTKRTRTALDDATKRSCEGTDSQTETRPDEGTKVASESSKNVDETAESGPAKLPRDGTGDVDDGEKEVVMEKPNEVQEQPMKSSSGVQEQIDVQGKSGLEEGNKEEVQSGGDFDTIEESRPAKRSRIATDDCEATKMSTEVSDMLGGGSEKTSKGNSGETNLKVQGISVESDDKLQGDIAENKKGSQSPGIVQDEPSMIKPSDEQNEVVMQKHQQAEVTPDEAEATKGEQNESGEKKSKGSPMVNRPLEPEAKASTKAPPASDLIRPKDGDVATRDGGNNTDSELMNMEGEGGKVDISENKPEQTNEAPADKQENEKNLKCKEEIKSGTDQQSAPMDVEAPETNLEGTRVSPENKLQQFDKQAVQRAEPKNTEVEKLDPTPAQDTTLINASSSPLNHDAEAPKVTSVVPKPPSLKSNTSVERSGSDDVKVKVAVQSSQDTKKEENQLEQDSKEFVDAAEKPSPHAHELDREPVLSTTPIESNKGVPGEMEKVGTSSADQAPFEEKQDLDEKPSQGGVKSVSSKDLVESTSLHQDAPVHKESLDALNNPLNATVEASEDDIEEFHDAHMELPSENESLTSPKTTVDDAGLTGQGSEKHGVVPTLPDTDTLKLASSKPVSKEGKENLMEKPQDATAEIANNIVENEALELPGAAKDERKHADDEDQTSSLKLNSSTRNEAGTESVIASSPDLMLEKAGPTKVTSEAHGDVAADPISSNSTVNKEDSTSGLIRSAPPKPKTRKVNGYQHDSMKLSRVKTLLYSTGSRVHRGRGFERIFAEYWDAIMLRLSDRLSSHTSESCERPIKAFLRSSRLRKLHNQFIRCIMKRATSSLTPYNEVASHIPRKWIDRVPKVVKAEPDRAVATDAQPSKKMGSDLLDRKACFTEAWVHDQADEGEIPRREAIVSKPSGGRERESSCIPGALVVDPLIRAAVRERDMQVSENAVWLLIVAVKEYISSLLKHSISHSESYGHGSIMVPGSYFGNTLVNQTNAAKKGPSVVKVGEKDESNPSVQGQNRSLSSLDIFMGSMQVGGSSMNTLGGSASRFALERCLQSAFVPAGLPPEDDFAQIQKFFVEEISSFARKRHLEAQSKPAAKVEPTTEQRNLGRVEHERKLHSDFEPADPKHESKGDPDTSKPSNAENPKATQQSNVPKSAVPTQAGQPASAAVAVGAPTNEAAASTSGAQPPQTSKDPDETKQSGASGPRGLGRSAKNLAALLKRAGTSQEDETAAEEVNKGGEGKSTSNPDRGQADTSNASRPAVQAVPPSQSPKDTAEPSEPAKTEDEDNEDAPVRRGKGFGIKNLAAMKARSTPKPDGTS